MLPQAEPGHPVNASRRGNAACCCTAAAGQACEHGACCRLYSRVGAMPLDRQQRLFEGFEIPRPGPGLISCCLRGLLPSRQQPLLQGFFLYPFASRASCTGG